MAEDIPGIRLELTQEGISHMEKIGKWASFLSKLGFIYAGILVLFALGVGFMMSSVGQQSGTEGTPSPYLGALYLVIAIIYIFPVLYLHRFSLYAQQSLRIWSTEELTLALKYLRRHYAYIGVLAIIAMALIPLGIVTAILIPLLR